MPRLGDARGLVVMRVRDGSPAAVAGLRDGDLLIEAEGAAIVGITSLRSQLAEAERRGRARLRVDRAGVVFALELPFAE
jgi:S1-C subfamily serine protease